MRTTWLQTWPRPWTARTLPPLKLSIIIPAYNEEAYLPATLDSIQAVAVHMDPGVYVGVIVVDNDSDDATACVALEKGAKTIHWPTREIAYARNCGARHATADVLVFIDADVIVPSSLFHEIYLAMNDPACVEGIVDVDYRPQRLSMRL